jgi:hypothetical protein
MSNRKVFNRPTGVVHRNGVIPRKPTMYTVIEFIRFLKFYQSQGLTIDEMVKLLEYYGDDELSAFISDQPESVSSS